MLKRRSRLLLAGFALLAPIILGGCDEEFCNSDQFDPLSGLVAGFLCLGYPSEEGDQPGDAHAEFDVTPSEIPSGGTVTLDASDSRASFDGLIVQYRWDLDGEYTVGARGRFFDFERSAAGGLSVRLFRRDPAFVRPPGEIIMDGDSETRIIALAVTDTTFQTASAVGQVRITGDAEPPVPSDPGAPPPVASFTFTPAVAFAGENFVFDASASERAVSYAWDFDDAPDFETGELTTPVISHRFTTPGLLFVRLRVTDAAGRTAVQVREVAVRPAEPPGSTDQAVAAGRPAPTPVTARLARVRFPAGLGRPRRAGRSRVFGPLTAHGRLIAARRGLGELRRFRRASWVARLRLVARQQQRAVRLQGVALARFARGAGKTCLRIRMDGRAGRVGAARVKVIGGTGKAAELAGSGRFRLRFAARTPRLDGRLSLRRVAARQLPRACAGL